MFAVCCLLSTDCRLLIEQHRIKYRCEWATCLNDSSCCTLIPQSEIRTPQSDGRFSLRERDRLPRGARNEIDSVGELPSINFKGKRQVSVCLAQFRGSGGGFQ